MRTKDHSRQLILKQAPDAPSGIPRNIPDLASMPSGTWNLLPLFIHIPRTAGSSVWWAFRYHFRHQTRPSQEINDLHSLSHFEPWSRPTSFDHISISTLLDLGIISEDWLATQWKFTVVRNPWERLLSLWQWRQNRPASRIGVPSDFTTFVKMLHTLPPIGILNFRTPPAGANPQLDWLRHRGTWIVDFVARYENLADDWAVICAATNIVPVPSLPKLRSCADSMMRSLRQRSKGKQFQDYYTPETREIVANYYEEEIALLGYSFE